MQLVSAIAPVLCIAALGFVLSRFRFLNREGEANLNSLVFSILIPALLFNGILKAELVGFNYLAYLAAYFLPLLLLFILSFSVLSLLKVRAKSRAVLAMSSVYGNVTVIGIPVCLHFLGDEALLPMSIIISVHNFILFTLATLAAEGEGLKAGRFWLQLKAIVLSLFKNPITMSLLSGLALNALGFSLPTVLDNAMALLGEAAVPLSFLVLGATLSHFSLKGELIQAVLLSVAKLSLLPLAVYFSATYLWAIDGLWLKTAVVIAAMPVGVSTQVIARRYQNNEALVASTIILSTLLSLFSLTVVMQLLGP
ncbi:AEC family transporter [Agaribacterium haliotis]|uniref:AEC family transporter n=1 Tax=Agaribacterium haliotis TaxID=2013869 RepID=UPI000BB564DA|nr:AEC family transporter [Agaribacterium haliotis]